ncbi:MULTISPECIES: hypothetical protein [unclassified Photobacterium]|nr:MULTISPECIES: hypothetical protein [unclassified Photobacterium]MDO6706823.1 hypothetical protein [Photobacterium sp. 1_MG-2023]
MDYSNLATLVVPTMDELMVDQPECVFTNTESDEHNEVILLSL